MPLIAKTSTPAPPIERFVLGNGLRVIVAPDRRSSVVAVHLCYDVGFRSEPEGRTGFAHLFEHLMFQGSVHLEKLEHFRYVQSSGGTFNGSTRQDFTDYFEILPSNALDRALYLEADRMAGPRITPENLANQVDVVKEEIRINVLNRPYGRYPWLLLPPVLFDTFANAHDGYGDFADLEAATVDDAAAFFRRYYAPSNAVLCIVGDVTPGDAERSVRRFFEHLPRRARPATPNLSEPDLSAERSVESVDRLAPLPAVAAGWRVPDPVREPGEFLAHVVLAELLSTGDAARLQRRLVQRDHAAAHVSAYVGIMGDPFSVRHPTALVVDVMQSGTTPAGAVLAAVQEELARLADGGPTADELNRVRASMAAQLFREFDPLVSRALRLGVGELVHGDALAGFTLPDRLAAVTGEQVRAAAAALRAERRAVVQVVPGAAGGAR